MGVSRPHRRHAAGSGTLGLDGVAAAIEAEVAGGSLPPGVRGAFEEARGRLRSRTDERRATEMDVAVQALNQGCCMDAAGGAAARGGVGGLFLL